MSLAQQRTKLVLAVIRNLLAEGRSEVRPGDVASRLREQNQPMGLWELRGELATLRNEGAVELDPDTGSWRMTPERSLKAG